MIIVPPFVLASNTPQPRGVGCQLRIMPSMLLRLVPSLTDVEILFRRPSPIEPFGPLPQVEAAEKAALTAIERRSEIAFLAICS